MMHRRMTVALVGAMLMAVVPAHSQEGGGERVEAPPVFRASEILPAALRQGPNFRVDPNVYNDGFNNIYTLVTPYGQFRVESTELLRIRVSEMAAVAKLEEVKTSDAFLKSVGKAATAPVRLAGDLVTKPISTVEGVVSGAGSHLRNFGRSLNPETRGIGEQGPIGTALGVAEIKRKISGRVGVDPYTTFPPLVQAVNRVAEPMFAANIGVTAAFAFIPGGVGLGIRASKFSGNMNEMLVNMAPSDLRDANMKSLEGMGVQRQLAGAFLNNSSSYSATDQTYITGALAAMNGVEDRAVFVQYAASAPNEGVAFFYRQQAEMMAAYHNRIGAVERIVPLGPYVALKTREGKVVGVFPCDYLAWTEALAGSADGSGAAAAKAIGEGEAGELWLEGRISKMAKEELTKRGWKVTAEAGEKLRLE